MERQQVIDNIKQIVSFIMSLNEEDRMFFRAKNRHKGL